MIISIASQKGGTGKTTTSLSLSSGLAYRGKKILLIDIDSQANSSKVLLDNYSELKSEQTIYNSIINQQPLEIHKTKIANLDIVPSHILVSDTDMVLATAMDRRDSRVKYQLDKIKNNYDHIFFDCPPTLSWLTINALTASDNAIVVVSPGYFELDSIVQIGKTFSQIQKHFNPDLKLLGFLFTMSDPTVNTITSLTIMRNVYSTQVFKTIIPRNVDIRDAHFQKKDIFSYNKHSKSAYAYDKLITEIFFPEQI